MSQVDSHQHLFPRRSGGKGLARFVGGAILSALLLHAAGAFGEVMLNTSLVEWQANAGPTRLFQTTAAAIGLADGPSIAPGRNRPVGGTLPFDSAAAGLRSDRILAPIAITPRRRARTDRMAGRRYSHSLPETDIPTPVP
jgi:hypothetical protein